MTRDEFIKSEHRALLKFDARTYDPNTSVAIPDREYTCECGFKTADPGEIFDHTTAHARGGETC